MYTSGSVSQCVARLVGILMVKELRSFTSDTSSKGALSETPMVELRHFGGRIKRRSLGKGVLAEGALVVLHDLRRFD